MSDRNTERHDLIFEIQNNFEINFYGHKNTDVKKNVINKIITQSNTIWVIQTVAIIEIFLKASWNYTFS